MQNLSHLILHTCDIISFYVKRKACFKKKKYDFLVPMILYKHFVILMHKKSILFPELSKSNSFLRLTSTVLNGLLQVEHNV